MELYAKRAVLMVRVGSILKKVHVVCLVLLVLGIPFGAQSCIAQGNQPKLAIEGGFSYCTGWFSVPFQAQLVGVYGRHGISGHFGWGKAGSYSHQAGFGYTFHPLRQGPALPRFDPSFSVTGYRTSHPSTPVLFNQSSIVHGINISPRFRINLPFGAFLQAQVGFCMESIRAPSYNSFFEDRIWVKSATGIGFGYYFQVRPNHGLRQRPDTLQNLALDIPQHSVAFKASRSNLFFSPTSIDYRLQYAYHWRPRWEAFAGLDAATTRWFFPVKEEQDSVQLLGGRAGLRFFPSGKRQRIAFFSDGSLGFMRLVKRHVLQSIYSKNCLQLELGCGFQARILPSLHANLAFFHRQYWTAPPSFIKRERENGIVFGLGWQFGGRRI